MEGPCFRGASFLGVDRVENTRTIAGHGADGMKQLMRDDEGVG